MSQASRPERFHMEPGVDPKGRLAVEQLLRDDACDAVDYRRSTASTNSLALEDLACPEPAYPRDPAYPRCPKLYLTDQQTAGRGRHGRRWVSSDATLTFSLVVPRAAEHQRAAHLAPLAVGLGIARYLEFEFAPVQVRLKWPNDVHVGGGKVAGILMETSSIRPDRMVIGVGINVGECAATRFEFRNRFRSGSGPSPGTLVRTIRLVVRARYPHFAVDRGRRDGRRTNS